MTPRSPAKPALRRRVLASALLLACVCSPQARTVAPAPAMDAPAIHPAVWPQPAWPLPRDAALEQRIDALMATMTVEEKVGQIIQGDIDSITPDDLRKYRQGSILPAAAPIPASATTRRRRTGWRWPMPSGRPRWTPRTAAMRSR